MTYKRQWRELSDETKQKISQSSLNKHKSESHKAHISQAMKDYWQNVPHRPNGELSMDEFLGRNNNDGKTSK